MKFSCRDVTTSRPIITRTLWVEVKSQFLYEISQKVLQYNIPDELIINADQTPSKFVATDNITMSARGAKHISRAGAPDKRAITVTPCESLDGLMLPFQLITGKQRDRYLISIFRGDSVCHLVKDIGVTRLKRFACSMMFCSHTLKK